MAMQPMSRGGPTGEPMHRQGVGWGDREAYGSAGQRERHGERRLNGGWTEAQGRSGSGAQRQPARHVTHDLKHKMALPRTAHPTLATSQRHTEHQTHNLHHRDARRRIPPAHTTPDPQAHGSQRGTSQMADSGSAPRSPGVRLPGWSAEVSGWDLGPGLADRRWPPLRQQHKDSAQDKPGHAHGLSWGG